MEYLIGIGLVYIVGTKYLTNNILVRKAISDRQNRKDTQFDEYTRDDYADERMFFPDNETDMQLLKEGVILGDKEYMLGPDSEVETASPCTRMFDVYNWANNPMPPSTTVAEGYLI